MNKRSPIYSVNTQCRDCYKCVRHCPVKAIYVENDHAVVSPEACILCGQCVGVCKNTAKQIRDDLPAARLLMQSKLPVYASLAPAFAAEFPGVRAAQMVTALKRLGFSGVYETADGADCVSRSVADYIQTSPKTLHLTTACPVAVKLVTHYFPHYVDALTPFLPPMLAHAQALRQAHGPLALVFIGPCVGKKHDADLNPNLLNLSLTFQELRRWFMVKGIWPADMPDDPDWKKPGDGAYYPIEGGMIAAVERRLAQAPTPHKDVTLMTVSGVRNIVSLLKTIDVASFSAPVCIELHACEGGCVQGPASASACTAKCRVAVLHYAAPPTIQPQPENDIHADYHAEPVEVPVVADDAIAKVLRELGKYQPEDELNCGGCGYDSCRELAKAIVAKHAETAMCVSHMRQLAQKKSNAIDRALPYGLVVAAASLLIMECNERFAKLFGETLTMAYEARPGLRDADLSRIIPFPHLFRHVLETGKEIIRKNITVDARIFSVSIFNIEPHTVVGALILDVTESEQRRQQLIDKARTVIQNTSKTVQEIAFMLGRNTAQSELILNSAVEMFAAEAQDDHDEPRLPIETP